MDAEQRQVVEGGGFILRTHEVAEEGCGAGDGGAYIGVPTSSGPRKIAKAFPKSQHKA